MTKTLKRPFKRKIEGRTDYSKRLRLLKSDKPRLVVRHSLKGITAQIVVFDEKGDKTIASADSKSLKKLGWTFACDNIPAAYLAGLAIGKTAVQNKISGVVLDSGLYRSTKGNRIYAVVKGAIDAGLDVPVDADMFPNEDRISGRHIQKFKDLPEKFEQIKKALMGGN